MKPKFRNLASQALQSIIIVSTLAAHANGADQIWTGATDALWTTAGNWNSAAPGAADIAVFDAASTTNLATTLGADRSIAGIKLIAPSGAVSVATGNALTLGASGIDMSAAAQALTISAPIVLGATQAWNVQTAITLTVSGGVSGTGPLTKSGAGTLTFGGTNTYTGITNISGGTLAFGGAVSTPGTGFNISNGAAVSVGNTASDNVGPVTFSTGGGSFTSALGVAQSRAMSTGSISVGTGITGVMSHNARTVLAEGAGATVSGAGTLTVNVPNNNATNNNIDGRYFINGNWSSFTGLLDLVGIGTNSTIQLNANATNGFVRDSLVSGRIHLSAPVSGVMNLLGRFGTNGIIDVGALSGTAATAIRPTSGGGNGVFRIGALGTNTTFEGAMTDASTTVLSITKIGSGTFTVTNSTGISYTGVTNINEGVYKFNGVKSGTGATTVNNGGTLAGTGTIAGTTTSVSGGIVAPGDAGTGNLTFANLTLNSGSILKLGATPDANKAVVQSGGTLTLASGATVDVNGFGTDGTYDIIDITGATLNGSAATALSAVNTVGGKVYTFSSTATAIRLTIAASDPSNYWNVDGGGVWDLGTNWTKGTTPNAVGAIAKIGPGVGGAGGSFSPVTLSITLDGNRTLGILAFDDDFGAEISINSGTPAGSLIMDNGPSPSNIVVTTGDHFINAPIVVNSVGTGVDVGAAYSLGLSGVVSGSGGVLAKSGGGTLTITADNTYSGGTILSGGILNINSATSLGDIASALRFSGGTLQLANDLSGISRSYQVAGTNSAIIDTNGFNFGYDGVISPFSGGTGGLTKNGAGTLTLSAAQTYTGATTVNAGTLDLPTGSSISGTTLNFSSTGGTQFRISGGSFNGTSSSVTAGASGFLITSGSATFSGAFIAQDSATGLIATIRSEGGTITAGSMSIGRSSTSVIAEPAAGALNSGLLVNGLTSVVNISGNLAISGSNSTANARIDSGTVTVGGTTTIGLNNGGRWSVLDVNGGTFNCSNTATGVQLGNGQTGNAIFLVQDGGIANVGRITFNQAQTTAYSEFVRLSGGALYVGAGGMAKIGTNTLVNSRVYVDGGTLGASANWTSTIDTTLTGTTSVIRAADALNAPFNITLSGVLNGDGNLTKTGAGVLTLSGANVYTGATLVNEGTLDIQGDNSAATGAVTVAATATLGGSGNIGGNVTIQSGGRQSITVAATAGAQVTRTITGSLNLAGGDLIDLTAAATPAGGSYVLVTATGGITGDVNASTINYNGITGTVSVSGNNLVLTVAGGGYSSWATANGATGQTPGQDHDGDGVDNGVEYFMGATGSTFTANPVPNSSNLITWPKDPAFSGTYTVQKSTNLATWTDVTSTDNGTSVTYTITGPDKQFVRLLVTPN